VLVWLSVARAVVSGAAPRRGVGGGRSRAVGSRRGAPTCCVKLVLLSLSNLVGEMSIINISDITVLDNPARFEDPYRFKITFECNPSHSLLSNTGIISLTRLS